MTTLHADPTPTRHVFRLATAATVVETASAGITWTGLPILLVAITGDTSLFVALFTAQTVASVIANTFAGALTDRYAVRAVVVSTTAAAALGLAVLAVAVESLTVPTVLAICVAIQLAGTVSETALRVWITSLAPPEELAQWIAGRAAWLTVAKLAGSSAGPILYGYLGREALWLNAALTASAIGAYLIAARSDTRTPALARAEGTVWRQLTGGIDAVRRDPALRRLLALQVCSGLIHLPLTAVAVRQLGSMDGVEPFDFTLFWSVGFAGALATNTVISRMSAAPRNPVRVVTIALAWSAVALACLSLVRVPTLFAVAFVAVVVGRTTGNVFLFSSIVPRVTEEKRGRIVALVSFAYDGAALIALAVFYAVPDRLLSATTFVYALCVALAVAVIGASANRLATAGTAVTVPKRAAS